MKLIITILFSIQFMLAGEVLPIEIPLKGEAAERNLEMSGLAWYGDNLILMPQYVDKEAPGFYYLSKESINDWLDGDRTSGLKPKPIRISMPSFENKIGGFEGFEAICFMGQKAFLIIESKHDGVMKSFLITGEMNFKKKELSINPGKLEQLNVPVNLKNMGFESILKYNASLMVLFEANGMNVMKHPKADLYTNALKYKTNLSIPNIEYRITDVSDVDGKGRFWALNHYWPGERKILLPGKDFILDGFNEGETHQKYEHVERLVELKIDGDSITRTDAPPVQLVLSEKSRNWEGLVRLGNKGFLMITDEHPRTILSFVPLIYN